MSDKFGRNPWYKSICIAVYVATFSIFSLIFLLNNYLHVVDGEAKNSQSQSLQVLEKHP